MNFGTAYLDGSGIYGATPESADKLREFDGGFLKVFEIEIVFLPLFFNYVDDKYHTLCWESTNVPATENIGTMSRLGS